MECLNRVGGIGDLDIRRPRERELLSATFDAFLESMPDVTWNRRFFLCERKGVRNGNQLFGIVGEKIKLGDVVCILYSCSVPIVLREVRTIDDHCFEFVGECYVHDMIDDEAIPNNRPKFPYPRAEIFKLK